VVDYIYIFFAYVEKAKRATVNHPYKGGWSEQDKAGPKYKNC